MSHADLVAMAEQELELARGGSWEALEAAIARRARAAAALPARPPASARGALERLQSLQREIVAQLELGRTATAHELRRVGSRRALRGYHGAVPAAAGRRFDAGA